MFLKVQDHGANFHPGHRSIFLDFFEGDRILPVLPLLAHQLVFSPLGGLPKQVCCFCFSFLFDENLLSTEKQAVHVFC